MTPSLPQVISAHIAGVLDGLNVWIPGRIESFDADSMRARVQPLIMQRYENEQGETVTETLPVLDDVPCVFPGSGGVRIRFPVSPGDECELHFASASLARWKKRGGLVDPGDSRRGCLSDAVAHLGLQSNARVAPTVIDVQDGEINIGELAMSSDNIVMRKSDAQAFMDALDDAILAAPTTGTEALSALQLALSSWLAGIDSIVKAR